MTNPAILDASFYFRYDHEVIQPAAELGDNLLSRVNLIASLLKRWLLGTHQGAVRPSHLDYYLDEFTFRFNRRTSRSRGMLFYRLLQQAVALPPVRGEELVGGRPLTKSPYPQHLGVRGVKCIPR
jgi:hypothetical protein